MNHDRSRAMDHVVLVLFENRSLDNLLGHLYGPEDGKTFEGVIGQDLSNPIPEWAEHGAERKTVPYMVATDMDAPNPDSGEEYFHTNTQLYNTLDEHNRFKIGDAVTAPWNVPPPGTEPTMDGFVTDYISTFTGEVGRQPAYEEYAQIMTGYPPEQVPVLNGIAKAFGVFDHWFCEVPYNTTFFIGWDEPGGTYDHVPPGPVPPPDPSAPAGQCDFRFDRSGYRVPAIIISPWVEEGTVINDEYRHTSLLATLRKVWDLGDAFTDRDAAARTFDHLLSRDTPRDPATWPDFQPRPLPEWQLTKVQLGEVLSTLGKAIGPGLLEHAKQSGLPVPAELTDPDRPPTPKQLVDFIFEIAAKYFPRLVPEDTEEAQTYR
jgi:hypothetical protein